ncbi:MAG: sigma-54 dependent transcriptional regulator [Chthoniobacteraceae bacterium]|jgi:DNA-binding NtrC family response regulator
MLLIIEDEHALASALAAVARRMGRASVLCATGARGLEEAAARPFAMAVLDIGLPDMSGLVVLERLRALHPTLPVVIITAHGNLENAMAAKQLGAAAYLVKPLDLPEVERTFAEVLAAAAAPPTAATEPISLMVGAAPAMQRCFVEIAHACSSQAPVLITGPTGTGKTHTARVIHANSARRAGPFITLHCASLPEPLLEAELFGHEKGAFTGATLARPGHVERAEGGTLFLDEIGDISPAVQARLLRVVEEKTFTRVGGREDLKVNLRLVTATSKSLRGEVRAGRFREDLYYRLHVLEIALPPLSERKSDLPALAAFLLGAIAPERSLRLSPAVLEVFQRHHWPGNVRELRNAVEHAAAVATGSVILPHHLPRELREPASPPPSAAHRLDSALAEWLEEKVGASATYRQIHDELEAMTLRHLLARYDGKPTILARELQMNRVTLRRRRQSILREDSAPE